MFEAFWFILGVFAIVCLLNIASHLRECHEAIQRHVLISNEIRKEIGELSIGLRINISQLKNQSTTVEDRSKSQYEKSLARAEHEKEVEQLKALHRDLVGY